MLITFFDLKGLVHHEFVLEGQTVNQYYKEVLGHLNDRVWRNRCNLWENHSWLPHHDNAPAHTALSVRQFLASKQVTCLKHPPYLPDLAPYNFWLSQNESHAERHQFCVGGGDQSHSDTTTQGAEGKGPRSAFKGGRNEWIRVLTPRGLLWRGQLIIYI